MLLPLLQWQLLLYIVVTHHAYVAWICSIKKFIFVHNKNRASNDIRSCPFELCYIWYILFHWILFTWTSPLFKKSDCREKINYEQKPIAMKHLLPLPPFTGDIVWSLEELCYLRCCFTYRRTHLQICISPDRATKMKKN